MNEAGAAVDLLRQRRPEGKNNTHPFVIVSGGRREGWRNNLDGLGLIKEEKRQKKDKKGQTV